jgi:ABC-type nitrate/sulfonate/bicarbonate transport system permease component
VGSGTQTGLNVDMAGDATAADNLRVSDAFRRRLPRPNWWQSIVSVVVGILLWQFWVDVFHPNPFAVVSPTQVFDAARNMAETGTLWTDFWQSLRTFFLGFVLGFSVGVLVGVTVGASRRLNAFIGPWITIFYSIPIIAIAPLLIIWIGFDMKARIVIVAVAAFFPVVINSRAGVQSVERGLRDVCTAFRANRREAFRYVLIPGSVPYILAGVRLALGRSLIALIFADLYGATVGLGYALNTANNTQQTANVYVVIVILAVMGLSFNGIVTLLERRFATYRAAV